MQDYILKTPSKTSIQISSEVVENLKSKMVKNFYRDDYSLFDFVLEGFNTFDWRLPYGKTSLKDFIIKMADVYLEFEYLKADLLECL